MICVSLGRTKAEKIREISRSNDLVELRMDLNRFSVREIEEIFSSSGNLIATFRLENGDEKIRRESLLSAVRSGAMYIDIDISDKKKNIEEMIREARSKKCKVILSYHDYNLTPDESDLKNISENLFNTGADIAKIACMVNSVRDIPALLSLYKTKNNIISIGMGQKGRITRVAGHFLGAPITYASYEGKKTAEGQIDSLALIKIIESIKYG